MHTCYINRKNGKRYVVLAEGIDCTNVRDGTPVIVYHPEDNPNRVCVREKAEFMVKFAPAPGSTFDRESAQ
jgi:hypothetical protein